MPKRINSLGIDYKAVFKGEYARMLIGQVKNINSRDNSRTVRCVKLSLDPKLLKYYNVRKHFRANDVTKSSQVGDIVLIKQLARPIGQLITHDVAEIMYKHGAIIDPISGKLCHGVDYQEQTTNANFEKYKQSVESEV